MAAASNYLETELLDHTFRNAAWTAPVTVYCALFTGATGTVLPALESNNPTTEVTGGAYARKSITFGAPSGGIITNSAEEAFTQATASWGTVTCMCICDHASNSTWGTNVNVLVAAKLDIEKTVDNGDTFKFAAGALDVSLS